MKNEQTNKDKEIAFRDLTLAELKTFVEVYDSYVRAGTKKKNVVYAVLRHIMLMDDGVTRETQA